jgi:hypothetical protein
VPSDNHRSGEIDFNGEKEQWRWFVCAQDT